MGRLSRIRIRLYPRARGALRSDGEAIPANPAPRGRRPVVRAKIQAIVAATAARCAERGLLPPLDAPPAVDPPKRPDHGDFATNAPLILAKPARKSPREVAQILVDHLHDPDGTVEKAEVAGPGFINLRLRPDAWFRALAEVLDQGDRFGRSSVGRGEKVLVEYVSANPTGPMHVGHGRGAVVGDTLASLLAAAGYGVTREFYINDAGGQIDTLGRTVHVRYRELFGEAVELPKDAYPGEYVVDIARRLKEKHGERYRRAPEAEWLPVFTDAAIADVLEVIRDDLRAMRITFDTWFSERALHQGGAVDRAIRALLDRDAAYEGVLPPPKGQVDPDYEARPQLLFRASAYGDDGDRTLKRSDGRTTYFAADVAYHWNKAERGFERLINVWGADHGGYVKRMQAAVEAATGRKGTLEVLLVQMVNLTRNGVPVKMSKRTGTFVALRDVVDELGPDSTRILFLLRRPDAPLEFDLELAKKQAPDNPVLYVQYGHARIASILRKAHDAGHREPGFDLEAMRTLTMPEERTLIRRVLAYPDLVERAALAREPHRVIFYLQETCAEFHAYYTQGWCIGERVISDDPKKRAARLFLCLCVRQVIRNALALLGVTAPERMDWPEEAEKPNA